MSVYLTQGEIKDIIDFVKNEATGLKSIRYVTGYSEEEAVDFLRRNLNHNEFLAWSYKTGDDMNAFNTIALAM